MPLDDVTLKALTVGAEGIRQAAQDIAITRTITQANDLVQQVRNSELSDAQKREQMAQISQQAVLNLTQAGSTPQAIKAVADAIDPRETIQSITQAMFSSDPETRKRGESLYALETANAFQLARLKKGSALKFSDLRNIQKDFSADKVNGQLLESLVGIRQAKTLAETGTAAGLNAAITTLAKALEGGKLTNEDVERIDPRQSIQQRLLGSYQRLLDGTVREEDIDNLRILLNAQEEKVSASLRQNVVGYARSTANISGLSPEYIANSIFVRHSITPGSTIGSQLKPKVIIGPDGKPRKIQGANNRFFRSKLPTGGR